MENTPPVDSLDESFQALKSVVENPQFQRVLAEIRKLPPQERFQAASTRLTVQALAASGVPIPVGLSITTSASVQSERKASQPDDDASDDASKEQVMIHNLDTTAKEDSPVLQEDVQICLLPPFQYICWNSQL